MCLLYVTNDVEEIGINNGKIVLKKYEDEHKQKIPCRIVEGISIFGRSRITEPCMRYCLDNGIRVSFFTVSGRCYGHITAEDQYNAERIRKQVLLSNDKNFSRKISKKIIKAKIHNQYIVAKRYIKSSRTDAEKGIIKLKQCIEKISTSITYEQIRGYEGLSSREYFKILGSLVAPEFKFTGRNRRPPLDPVNTMLSLGYSLLTKEMQGELENRGLISQVGFFHEDHIHHPTLASDMIEEWRPVIVDSLVLSLIRGHEIDLSAFEMCDGKCLFTKTGLKLFLQKYEKKLFAESKYLPDINRPITFRQAIWHQAENLAKAIDESDSEKYIPIQIR